MGSVNVMACLTTHPVVIHGKWETCCLQGTNCERCP